MRLTVGQLRQVIKEEVARVRASRNGGNRRRLRENAAGADHVLYTWNDDVDGGYGFSQPLVDEILDYITPTVTPVEQEIPDGYEELPDLEERLTFKSPEARQAFLAVAALLDQDNEFSTEEFRHVGRSSAG